MNKRPTIFESFGHALSGFGFAVVNNRNMMIHLVIAVIVIILCFAFRVQKDEFVDLIVMIILVISAEMINTSIEEMTNLITNEHRMEAKIAKDVSAGMVLVVSFGAAAVGLYILLPYFLKLI